MWECRNESCVPSFDDAIPWRLVRGAPSLLNPIQYERANISIILAPKEEECLRQRQVCLLLLEFLGLMLRYCHRDFPEVVVVGLLQWLDQIFSPNQLDAHAGAVDRLMPFSIVPVLELDSQPAANLPLPPTQHRKHSLVSWPYPL